MTNEEYLDKIRTAGENLRKDPEKLVAFLKGLGLFKNRKILKGVEREQVETMLRLIGPGEDSNNQHLWCETWIVGNTTYEHVTGNGVDELVEITEDDK